MFNTFFQFEKGFITKGIHCIPMTVRYKLDRVGIKLELEHWYRLPLFIKEQIIAFPMFNVSDLGSFDQMLTQILISFFDNTPLRLTPIGNIDFTETDYFTNVNARAKEYNISIEYDQWCDLDVLHRYALTKLSTPGHEHKNFMIAMEEFGIVCSGDFSH